MEHESLQTIYPIQPDIALNTYNYQEKKILWNPLTQNLSILFQFTVLEGKRNSFFILPDGCIEILFRCSIENPTMTLFGKRTKSRYIELKPGCTYFGFRPYYEAGFQLHAFNYLDIIDQMIELQSMTEYEELILSLANAKSFEGRCSIYIKSDLFNSCCDKVYRYNYVIECSRKICMSRGAIKIDSLGDDLGYTNRHIRNSYKNVFGISPVYYKEIIRFQNSVHLLYKQQVNFDGDYVGLSQDSGFCDQSYMISTYKKFTQMTPKMLRTLIFG